MSKFWPQFPLNDMVEVAAGNPAPQDTYDFCKNGALFIRMQDVGREHHTKNLIESADKITEKAIKNYRLRLFPTGSVLIPKSGASINLNHRAMLGKDAYVVSHLAVLVPDHEKLISEYLYYWSLTYDPRDQAQTTSLPSLPISLIKTARIPVPPLPEQRRLVDILSHAEGIVRLRREAQKKAQKLIPALFLDMFGDPATNPKGWSIVKLGDLLAESPTLGTMIKPSSNGGRWLDLRVANIQDGRLKLDDSKFINLLDDQIDRFKLQDGDIVLARAIGSLEHLGKAIVVYPGKHEWTFDSHLMRIRLNKAQLLPEILKIFLESSNGRKEFLRQTRRSAVQFNINGKELRNILVPLPPISLQLDFLEWIKNIESLQSQQSIALEKAEATFQSLLHRAFAGQL